MTERPTQGPKETVDSEDDVLNTPGVLLPLARAEEGNTRRGKVNHARAHAKGVGNEPHGNKAGTRHRLSRRTVRAMAQPFVAASKTYLDGVKAYYRPSTLERARRDLRTIRMDLETLTAERKIGTMSPRVMTERDVEALLILWRTRPVRRWGRDKPLDLASQAHLVKTLGNILGYFGNNVIETMRRKKYVRLPVDLKDKLIRVLTDNESARIRAASDTFEGWRGSVARFLVAFLPATGLRPKEFRLAKFEDLDLDSWTIGIAHPKGEQSWASAGNRTVILPTAEEAVKDFLRDRALMLGDRIHEALVPFVSEGELSYWSECGFRKMVCQLVQVSGVRFSLKDFRSTFAQSAKDRGVSIEAVSRAMRHRNTKTTEQYYARMRPEAAFKELREAFLSPVKSR